MRTAIVLTILNELQSAAVVGLTLKYPRAAAYAAQAIQQLVVTTLYVAVFVVIACVVAYSIVWYRRYALAGFALLLAISGCAHADPAPRPPTVADLQAEISQLQHQHDVDTVIIKTWKTKADILEDTLIRQNAELKASGADVRGDDKR